MLRDYRIDATIVAEAELAIEQVRHDLAVTLTGRNGGLCGFEPLLRVGVADHSSLEPSTDGCLGV